MSGFTGNDRGVDESAPLLSVRTLKPSPVTLTKLVNRLRAMTFELLPVEVDPESLNDPTSRVITPQVIAAYQASAGDFVDALPYCLLRARAEFMWDANHNPADYGENFGRAIACEVLARRIVHQAPSDRLNSIMSTRFRHRQIDGAESDLASALEMAIDTNCSIFLSSNEAQYGQKIYFIDFMLSLTRFITLTIVVLSLWNGHLIQKNNKNDEIDYVHYAKTREDTFWGHLDVARLSVPRYQNIFRVSIWLFFLVVYSQAVREPLEKLDHSRSSLDDWEIVLYVMALAFFVENTNRIFKLLRFVTWRAVTFWNVISFVSDSLLLAAFVLRVVGLGAQEDQSVRLRLTSFQVLSFVSPFIWTKLITIFDGYKYIGTMQICVARMLQESGIFFALLSVLGLGFIQALYALDAADGESEHVSVVVNLLVQALFGSPNFDRFVGSPAGLILYYFWNVATAVILLNVLISLFSSAYSDIVDNAEAQYLAFFASKTIEMIRAPDSYVYPAPFNLIEVFFVAPFELCPGFRLSDDAYRKLNRIVMSVVFFLPMAVIAFYEATFDTRKHAWMKNWLRGFNEGEQDSPEHRDPVVDDEQEGLKISKVPFSELIKGFPNTQQSSEATILKEIGELRDRLDLLVRSFQVSAGSGMKKEE